MSGDELFTVKEYKELVLRGNALLKKGRYAEAVKAWRGAIAADPSRKKELEPAIARVVAKQCAIYFEEATKLEKAGREDEALAIYRKAMALAPADPQLKSKLRTKIESREARAELLSKSAFLMIASCYGLTVLLSLAYILFVLE